MFSFRRDKAPDQVPEKVFALIAEDEALLRMNATEMLEDMGFLVAGAETADEALSFLKANTVELLITDIHMPGKLDGLDLARTAAGEWPDLHIVICSGRSRIIASDLPPRTKFVAKPYTMDQIEEAILSFPS